MPVVEAVTRPGFAATRSTSLSTTAGSTAPRSSTRIIRRTRHWSAGPTHGTVRRADHRFQSPGGGALHRANGGYLLLDAQKLLTGNFGWASLKRALDAGQIRIETLEQLLSMASTVSLQPEPIPLKVKVVLLGPPALYYLLARSTRNSTICSRSPPISTTGSSARRKRRCSTRGYLRVTRAKSCGRSTAPPSRASSSRRPGWPAIPTSSRLACATSAICCGKPTSSPRARARRLSAVEVQEAIDAQFRRGDRIYRRLQEEIGRKTIRIETDGDEVGQVNGLSVICLGGLSFGHPSRITAQVRLGRGEVVDIEREVELGGPLIQRAS